MPKAQEELIFRDFIARKEDEIYFDEQSGSV
jgi:hypothetical protein